MTWSSMISLWINCRTHQSPNNNLELSKENVLGNIMLSHLPCFTWKFFMIWFHKILKLIFKKQPSCSTNICTKHWRKLPNLTAFLEIFLFLKNKDSVKHVKKVLLIVLSIYFEDKIKFSHCIWSIWLFWILFLFSSAIYFLKWNRYFSASENLPNSSCHFPNHESLFLQVFASLFSVIKDNSSILF